MTLEKIKARRAAGEGGFTLIELLVVIIILGILAAVVVFAVGGVGDKGNSASCVIDTRTLRTALEANYANNNTYTVAAVDQTAPAAGALVNETALVTAGFLSEASDLHDARIYDSDADVGEITPAVAIFVQDGDPPGGDCGTAGNQVGQTAADI